MDDAEATVMSFIENLNQLIREDYTYAFPMSRLDLDPANLKSALKIVYFRHTDLVLELLAELANFDCDENAEFLKSLKKRSAFSETEKNYAVDVFCKLSRQRQTLFKEITGFGYEKAN